MFSYNDMSLSCKVVSQRWRLFGVMILKTYESQMSDQLPLTPEAGEHLNSFPQL